MSKRLLLPVLLMSSFLCKAQYNNLWIPDTLSGTSFNLTLKDTFAQIISTGSQTITAGVNGKFWGPTLFMNKGDVVHINVQNNLNDSTTIHWHGMHLPAVMDGGPHQVIPPGTLWSPYWKVSNNAATFWYHPHLHMTTNAQMTAGLGGFIIVRDSLGSALALPRSYGVDDFPLAISDRRFTASNQFVVTNYTDSLMVNGVLRPQLTIPAQIVRFRMLNVSSQHSYNIGFSDSRSFSVIGSDGGLLNAPVAVTRYILSPGERVEILVNCNGQQGQVVDIKAYNSSLATDIFGATHTGGGPTDGLLGANFNILHLNITSPTASAITTIPTSLVANAPLSASSSMLTRTIKFIDGFLAGFPNTSFDGVQFDMNLINYTVPLNNIETWQIINNSTSAHAFHIHDVQFNVLSRTGSTTTLAAYDQGWKDNILVRAGETLKFIAKFDDYADATHPFMYHCHMAIHEDEGMMGQFVVSNISGINTLTKNDTKFTVYPNPTSDKLFVRFNDVNQSAYYVRIIDVLGRTLLMLPKPDLQNGIDISSFSKGTYTILITDEQTKQNTSQQFIIK